MPPRIDFVCGALAVVPVALTVALSERVLGLDSAETARRYVSLSVYLFALQRHAEAWLAAQRALLLFTVLAGPKHPEIASLHITLSNIAIELKDANRMIYHANEAQKIRVAAYGSEHEAVGEVHQSTAFLYHRIGRSQIACRLVSGVWLSFGVAVFVLSSLLRRHMQRASAIFENKYGPDHSKTQDSLQLVSIPRRVLRQECHAAHAHCRLRNFRKWQRKQRVRERSLQRLTTGRRRPSKSNNSGYFAQHFVHTTQPRHT